MKQFQANEKIFKVFQQAKYYRSASFENFCFNLPVNIYTQKNKLKQNILPIIDSNIGIVANQFVERIKTPNGETNHPNLSDNYLYIVPQDIEYAKLIASPSTNTITITISNLQEILQHSDNYIIKHYFFCTTKTINIQDIIAKKYKPLLLQQIQIKNLQNNFYNIELPSSFKKNRVNKDKTQAFLWLEFVLPEQKEIQLQQDSLHYLIYFIYSQFPAHPIVTNYAKNNDFWTYKHVSLNVNTADDIDGFCFRYKFTQNEQTIYSPIFPVERFTETYDIPDNTYWGNVNSSNTIKKAKFYNLNINLPFLLEISQTINIGTQKIIETPFDFKIVLCSFGDDLILKTKQRPQTLEVVEVLNNNYITHPHLFIYTIRIVGVVVQGYYRCAINEGEIQFCNSMTCVPIDKVYVKMFYISNNQQEVVVQQITQTDGVFDLSFTAATINSEYYIEFSKTGYQTITKTIYDWMLLQNNLYINMGNVFMELLAGNQSQTIISLGDLVPQPCE